MGHFETECTSREFILRVYLLEVTDLLLVLLEVPFRLSLGFVDTVQRQLQLIDVLLQLLLHSHRFHFVPRFRLKIDLHRVQRALVIFAVRTRQRTTVAKFISSLFHYG